MKILLIAPASGRWRNVKNSPIFNGKTFRFSLLSLLSVAAETPSDIGLRIIDEQVDSIPWEEDFDLVGITCMTATAPRAYEIARRFRDRKIPVVLGGMHPTLYPEDAINHADTILIGQAEEVWPEIIEDVKKKKLKTKYYFKEGITPGKIEFPPRHLLNTKDYATINAVQATRGCPNKCDFCSVTAFHNYQQYKRPIGEVIHEVENIPNDFFLFIDDNLMADKEYATGLFENLLPLNKKWITQSTLSMAEDRSFVDLAAKAGCIGIFAGLETFSNKNLTRVNKSFHRAEAYRDSIKILHQHGIGVEAGIVFGFDGDTSQVFETTLKTLDRIEIDAVQFSIFTPLPGTQRFYIMKDRIFDFDWSHYDFHNVVFQPKEMSPRELKAGHDWVTREFYRPWRIARRLARHLRRPNGLATIKYVAALNLAYYGRIRNWGIKGWNPAVRANRERKQLSFKNGELKLIMSEKK